MTARCKMALRFFKFVTTKARQEWRPKTLLLLPFFLGQDSWDERLVEVSLRSLTASVGLAATLSARMCIPRAVYLHDCRGRRGFAPNVFLFMFFPNCFIMPNLSSLEDASYHVQILFILLYWHRNNRCLIYIVIFSKRDVCIFWKCYNFSCFSMGFFGLWFCTAMYRKQGEFKCSLETPHNEIPNSSPLLGHCSHQCRQQSIKKLLSK